MQDILRNIIVGFISLIPIFPLAIIFDIIVNAYLHPLFSPIPLSGSVLVAISVLSFAAIVVLPMVIHDYILELDI